MKLLLKILRWYYNGPLCKECKEVKVARGRTTCSFCDKNEGMVVL